MKLTTKEQAELFAKGFEKGRAFGLQQSGRIERRITYARRRVSVLARWKSYAIDRLGLGNELVAEIDREARKSHR